MQYSINFIITVSNDQMADAADSHNFSWNFITCGFFFFFCFLSILLYPDQFFYNDYLDYTGFVYEMEYISFIQNDGNKMANGFRTFFNNQ